MNPFAPFVPLVSSEDPETTPPVANGSGTMPPSPSSKSSSPSLASINSPRSISGLASEEENIDSFNVNPKSGRWNVSDSNTDDYIIDGNLRLIGSNNGTGQSYYMDRGLSKTDSKIEYRYKASADNNSQVEYFRDVLGDSADFEEGDQEGFTLLGSTSSGSVSNGIFTYTVTNSFGGIHFDFSSAINLQVYTSLSFQLKASESISNILFIRFADGDGNRIIGMENGEGGSDYGIYTTWTDYNFDLTQDSEYTTNNEESIYSFNIQYDSSASGKTIQTWIDDIKLTGDLDYATHDSTMGDTWDWEDSQEYFYDDYGNVSDFNDGTTEGFYSTDLTTTITNEGNEYLKVYDPDDGFLSFQKDDLSITASTYRYLAVEFNNSADVIEISVKDNSSAEVCRDSSTWTSGQWHLFTCDLGADADWTGTETTLYFRFRISGTGQNIFVNMIYLYDTSLGDLESISTVNPLGSSYGYVNPEGYYTSRITNIGSGTVRFGWWGSLSIDATIFDYMYFRAKASETETLEIRDDSNTVLATKTLTTSWQTFSIDLTGTVWSGTETEIYLIDKPATLNVQAMFDYFLVKSQSETEQKFTVGFTDASTGTPVANITHHFFNSTTFRWEVELYDSNNEVASYYYSANQTLTDAGYPAVDTDLYVDGFSSTYTGWNTSGSSPWLDSQDTSNYIYALNNSLQEGWFTFADLSSSHTDSYTTALEIYVLEGDGNDDLVWKIDTSGDNIPEYQGTILDPTSGWYSVSLDSITTKTNINSARLMLEKKQTDNDNNTLKIDSARLSVTHASTEQTNNCFTNFCRVKIKYNLEGSYFTIEVDYDSYDRVFKADWTDEFTTTGVPVMFSLAHIDLFANLNVQYYGSMEVWIDYINAKYEEREWKQITGPNDTDWITDTQFSAQSDGPISSGTGSEFQLIVPKLDVVSGKLYSNVSSNVGGIGDGFANISFTIYGVVATTGVYSSLVSLNLYYYYDNINGNDHYYFALNQSSTKIQEYDACYACMGGGSAATMSPATLSFSIGLTNDRKTVHVNALGGTSESNLLNNYLLSYNKTLDSSLSDEFVLDIRYYMKYGDNAPVQLQLQELDFKQRDIFADIYNAVVSPITDVLGGLFAGLFSFIGDIFVTIGRFLATIFKVVGDAIVSGLTAVLTTLQTALTSALSALQSALSSAINALAPIISAVADTITGVLSPLLDNIIDFLSSLANDIWNSFINFMGDVIDQIANLLTQLWNDVILPIINYILGIINTIIDGIIAGASYLLDQLLDLMPFGIGDFVRNFTNLNISNVFQTIFDTINWILTLSAVWLIIVLGFYQFVLPFLKNIDEPGNAINDMLHNMFSLHGMDFTTGLGNLTVPIRFNAFIVWLFLIILFGYLSLILPFNLF